MPKRIGVYSPMTEGSKACFRCKVIKPYVDFKPDSRMKDGRHSWCIECWRKYYRDDYAKKMQDPVWAERRREASNRSSRKRRAEDPSLSRFHTIKHRYGVSRGQYEEMLEGQGGTCANPACTQEPTHLDHDHRCCPTRSKGCGRCVRGILCMKCNVTLGNVEDDVEILQGLIDYLLGQRIKDSMQG